MQLMQKQFETLQQFANSKSKQNSNELTVYDVLLFPTPDS